MVADDDEFPFNFDVTFSERAVVPGYTQWSETYDAPSTNPALIIEEAIVHPILARLPLGRALDVACGTGRHACHLRHSVTTSSASMPRRRCSSSRCAKGAADRLPRRSVRHAAGRRRIDRRAHLRVGVVPRAQRGVGNRGVRGGAASRRHGRRIRHASDVHEHRRRGGVSVERHHERALRAQPRTPRRRMVRGVSRRRVSGGRSDEGFGDADTAKLLPSYAAFPEATVPPSPTPPRSSCGR